MIPFIKRRYRQEDMTVCVHISSFHLIEEWFFRQTFPYCWWLYSCKVPRNTTRSLNVGIGPISQKVRVLMPNSVSSKLPWFESLQNSAYSNGLNHGGTGRDCPLQSFAWGDSSVDCPPQSSGFGGTLLSLVSWDLIKSMSHIIILNQPLLSYSSPYTLWPVEDLGGSGPPH